MVYPRWHSFLAARDGASVSAAPAAPAAEQASAVDPTIAPPDVQGAALAIADESFVEEDVIPVYEYKDCDWAEKGRRSRMDFGVWLGKYRPLENLIVLRKV